MRWIILLLMVASCHHSNKAELHRVEAELEQSRSNEDFWQGTYRGLVIQIEKRGCRVNGNNELSC